MALKPFRAEKRAIIEDLEEKAYRAFVLETEKAAINMAEFSDRYSASEIARDQDYVRDRQGKFAPQERILERRGKILEAIIFIQSELNNWFGENAFTVKTSLFDDIAHGVDLVVELVDNEGISRLFLAIDVTTTQDEEYLSGKLLKIKKEVEEGKLSRVKYFQSEADPEFREPLLNIPRVVLAADTKTLHELIELSLNKDPRLANHPVQRQFLEEMGLQLARFIPFASSETAKKLADALALIQGILASKQNIPTDFRHEDQGYILLKSILESIAQEKKAPKAS